jgi:MFS family permease
MDAGPGRIVTLQLAAFDALRPAQLAWLAAAVIAVSAGYGALMPVLPGWLGSMMLGASASDIARHVGFFSGVYAAGVLFGALLWGALSNRIGRSRVLIIGLIGYVASLMLLLVPTMTGLWGLYAVRAATGFFVAAVVPVVSALVAEHTHEGKRARRFAWLSAMSLLGFLVGPGLIQLADWLGTLAGTSLVTPVTSARNVIVLSAVLGAVMMLGLIRTLTPNHPQSPDPPSQPTSTGGHIAALCCLNATVMLVLAGFELGIVLQGLQHADMSTRQVAWMFAECSLAMLLVNATLFFTDLLEKVSSRTLIGVGLVLASAGLAVMAWHSAEQWLYLGISLASGGTGLVLPVIVYRAAAVPHRKLGFAMGALAAVAGVGQTLGSSLAGAIFGAMGQGTFGLMIVPFVVALALLLMPQAVKHAPDQ